MELYCVVGYSPKSDGLMYFVDAESCEDAVRRVVDLKNDGEDEESKVVFVDNANFGWALVHKWEIDEIEPDDSEPPRRSWSISVDRVMKNRNMRSIVIW